MASPARKAERRRQRDTNTASIGRALSSLYGLSKMTTLSIFLSPSIRTTLVPLMTGGSPDWFDVASVDGRPFIPVCVR